MNSVRLIGLSFPGAFVGINTPKSLFQIYIICLAGIKHTSLSAYGDKTLKESIKHTKKVPTRAKWHKRARGATHDMPMV